VLRLEAVRRVLVQDLDDVQHRPLLAEADVDRARGTGSRRAQVRVDDVVDVDVVACLLAVSEDRGPAAVQHLAAEDRDHAGLAERVLPRAVDVAVAERDGRESVETGEDLAVLLGAELGETVRRLRRDPVVLGRRHRLQLAVDGAACGGVDEAPHPVRLRRAQHVGGALDVDAGVGRRVGHRLAHVDLGGEVEDHLGPEARDDVVHGLRLSDVDVGERGAVRDRLLEVLALAGREIVDHGDLVTAREKRVDEIRSDEAGAAGNECIHAAEDGRRRLA
jgi:hypothetical protein